jgi:hypothetical protein
MSNELSNAVRIWWHGLSFFERLGVRALGAAAVLALVIAVAPKAVAAALGGAMTALGVNVLAYAFAADGR